MKEFWKFSGHPALGGVEILVSRGAEHSSFLAHVGGKRFVHGIRSIRKAGENIIYPLQGGERPNFDVALRLHHVDPPRLRVTTSEGEKLVVPAPVDQDYAKRVADKLLPGLQSEAAGAMRAVKAAEAEISRLKNQERMHTSKIVSLTKKIKGGLAVAREDPRYKRASGALKDLKTKFAVAREKKVEFAARLRRANRYMLVARIFGQSEQHKPGWAWRERFGGASARKA